MREIRSSGSVGERGGNEPLYPDTTDLFWESNEQVYARNAEFWTLIKEKNNTLKTR